MDLHEDGRVVKAAGLRSAVAIRVGSIPTPRKMVFSKPIKRMAGISAENADILRPKLEHDYAIGKEMYYKYLSKILIRDAVGAEKYKDMLIRHIDQYPLIYDVSRFFEHVPIPLPPIQSNMHVARWSALRAPPGHEPLGDFENHAVPRPKPKRARRTLRNYFEPPVERNNTRLTPIARNNGNNNGNNNNRGNNRGNNGNNNRRSQTGGKKTRRRRD